MEELESIIRSGRSGNRVGRRYGRNGTSGRRAWEGCGWEELMEALKRAKEDSRGIFFLVVIICAIVGAGPQRRRSVGTSRIALHGAVWQRSEIGSWSGERKNPQTQPISGDRRFGKRSGRC